MLAAATGLDGYDERPQLTMANGPRCRHPAAIRDIAAGYGLRRCCTRTWARTWRREAEVERFLADSDLAAVPGHRAPADRWHRSGRAGQAPCRRSDRACASQGCPGRDSPTRFASGTARIQPSGRAGHVRAAGRRRRGHRGDGALRPRGGLRRLVRPRTGHRPGAGWHRRRGRSKPLRDTDRSLRLPRHDRRGPDNRRPDCPQERQCCPSQSKSTASLGRVLPWPPRIVLAACSGPAALRAELQSRRTAPPARRPDEASRWSRTAAPGDAFWNVVKNGADARGQAARRQRSTTSSDGDPGQQAKLIDNAVAQDVDGLVVSMANPDALQDLDPERGHGGHPGRHHQLRRGPERELRRDRRTSGRARASRARARASAQARPARHKLLCVIHEAGNIGLTPALRRREAGLRQRHDHSAGRHQQPDRRAVPDQGRAQADPSIDAVLTLNSQVAAARGGRGQGGRAPRPQVATFDLNADVVDAIKAGKLAVRGRPAAVRAGLPADRVAAAVQGQRATPSAAASRCRPAPASSTRPMSTPSRRTRRGARDERR